MTKAKYIRHRHYLGSSNYCFRGQKIHSFIKTRTQISQSLTNAPILDLTYQIFIGGWKALEAIPQY